MIINKDAKALSALQEKIVPYGENVQPDEGYSGFSKVTIEGVSKSQENVSPGTSEIVLTTPSGGADVIGQVTVDDVKTTGLAVEASQNLQTITTSAPYVGFHTITARPARLYSLFANPSESNITYQTPAGYYGIGSVLVKSAALETRTITPTTVAKTYTPSSGYYGFKQVTISGASSIKSCERIMNFPSGRYSTGDIFANNDEEFVTNPTYIIVYPISDVELGGDDYKNCGMMAEVNGGTVYYDDFGYIKATSTNIDDLNYMTIGTNRMGFGLPSLGSSYITFAPYIQYFIGIYGT